MHPSLPLPLRKIVSPRIATLTPIPIRTRPEVSVIIPARNEEASLGDCLQSLLTQAGVRYEIIVVDDGSTDHTRAIAESCSSVRVISPGLLPEGWTGKNNAVVAGAAIAKGDWLLFTDADTVHLPGSLARALAEAKEHGVDMLSYSPEQIAITFWEKAVLPVVFAELASQYPPELVSDPASPIAAANGQYILIRRQVYEAVGGHRAIADNLLEDVALARAVKGVGGKLRFRYGSDAVRTRMYRNFRQLREGWTKNLALLFPTPGWLAAKSLLRWALAWGLLLYPVALLLLAVTRGSGIFRWFPDVFPWRIVWFGLVCLTFNWLYRRVRRANFDLTMEFLGTWCGYPMFVYLLLRSKDAHTWGSVSWKGRAYRSEQTAQRQTAVGEARQVLKTGS
jgi:glycosyltransferase involved in cell wall biosynthesis